MSEENETAPPVPDGEREGGDLSLTETASPAAPEDAVESTEEPNAESPALDDAVPKEPVAVAAEGQPDPLGEIAERLAELTDETTKHHERAARRETVIDTMHAELEQLRRGERRSLLRPLVTEVCRLRDDLLRQAATLPEAFDREQAAELLRSYAESLEFTLENNGVTSFVPEAGEAFEARRHRVTSKAATSDAGLTGTIATVVSPGYHDVEADTVITTARVVVYVADRPGGETRADTDGDSEVNPISE